MLLAYNYPYYHETTILDLPGGDLLLFIFIILGIIIYYLIAAYPANLAFWLISSPEDTSGRKKNRIFSYWLLIDRIKRQRLMILSFLFICLLIIIYANLFYFFRIVHSPNISDFGTYLGPNTYFIPLLVSFGILIVYSISEILKYGKINISETEHEKSSELKKVIENLAITAGVKAPDFKILAFNNPTAFSIYPNFKKPIIYITAPLLSLADRNELEAVIGHEFANIFSGKILYFQRINNILIFIRAFSYLLLFLFLWSISPFLPFIWAVYLSIVVAQNIFNMEKIGEHSSFLRGIITLFNPPYAIIKFLTYTIYYATARNEEFYADLKTIELTRYPAGIYSILRKMKNYDEPVDRLPEKFSYLYFTGENTVFKNIPMAQPTITERKGVLEEIDQTLVASRDVKEFNLKCPYCRENMERKMMKSLYGHALRSYYCKKCDGFWFNSWSLWSIRLAENELNSQTKEEPGIKLLDKLLCPNCSVKLELIKDENLPIELQIWYCPVCYGNWLFNHDMVVYNNYRKKFRKTTLST